MIILDPEPLMRFHNGMRVERLGSRHLCRLAGRRVRMMAPIQSGPEAVIGGSAFAVCISRAKFPQRALGGECFVKFTFFPMKRNRLQKGLDRLNGRSADF